MILDSSLKGFPIAHDPLALELAGAQGWRVLAGDLPFPLAVLKDSALRHNIAWMAAFCRARGIALAPHGKTTMSPEIHRRQLDAGAWGITYATVHQAAIGAHHGVPRVVIANQVLQRADLDGLAALHAEFPALRSLFLVDSAAQVREIDAWHRARGRTARFDVLLEVGIDGRRTGCRTREQALAVAQAIAASDALRLAGVECYEGGVVRGNDDGDAAAVRELMARVHAIARECAARGWFAGDEVIVSAGGSAAYDLVARELVPDLGRPVRGVLRSGCYVTHDHVHYRDLVDTVERRLGERDGLRAALELVTCVQSCPEPGLALLTMGKRDVSYDLELPVALWRARRGDDATRTVPSHWSVAALNDQHAYLRFDAASDDPPRVGDIVGCGISHPCTTFDKWKWMPVVDDGYRVVDAVSVRF